MRYHAGVMPRQDSAILNAIVICERVITDQRTANKSLIDCFSAVVCPTLPFPVAKLVAFVSVTNVLIESELEFILSAPSGAHLVSVKMQLQEGSPQHIYDFVCDLSGTMLEEQGMHTMTVYSQGKPIGSRHFNVVLRKSS